MEDLMTYTYQRPNLDRFSPVVTDADLKVAGVLIRFSLTPTAKDLGPGKPSFITHVAEIVASQGCDAALLWLDGWWYATGVREHTLTTSVQQLILTGREATERPMTFEEAAEILVRECVRDKEDEPFSLTPDEVADLIRDFEVR